MIRPLSSFVAKGQVSTVPVRDDDPSSDWFGHFMSEIRNVALLPRRRTISDVRAEFPEWAWLRQPRKSATVPIDIAGRFMSFFDVSTTAEQSGELSALEGLRVEQVRFALQRNRSLRDEAFRLASGTCCVCDTDFSKLLNGDAVRVLQVHHRRQLSSSDLPRQTKLADLAVVCANCHLLLHLNVSKPTSVEKLRAKLGAATRETGSRGPQVLDLRKKGHTPTSDG